MSDKRLLILGTRGVPAAHGGFETFAEHLATYLVGKGWSVTVYCQDEGSGPLLQDDWKGVCRVRMPISIAGAAGTIVFDWLSTLHASRGSGVVLTLGYNTALFGVVYRLKGVRNIINMDGVEWRRRKWGSVAKIWFWLNDWAGCRLGNHLVADHPEIKRHLATRVSERKITMIPYGSDRVDTADAALVEGYGVMPGKYAILIARAEPENSILEVVRAWSRRPRGKKLLVLGKYGPDHSYQQAVQEAASDEVLFPGGIYEKVVVQALRYHALFYVHGHQVGGTNPSLVEALAAGNAVLAHDNPYNRWVAGHGGVYFQGEETCEHWICRLLEDADSPTAKDHGVLLARLRREAQGRHAQLFTWELVLEEYERLLEGWCL